MKAIRVHKFGGPDVMQIEEVPTPKPDPGQVLVKIHAAGVVETTGEGIRKVKPGDRVYLAKNLTGSYAEYALALESQVYRMPEKISFAQGAGIFIPYGTAYHAIVHEASTRASDTVLVHGASGGVGIAAIQFLRGMGCTIFGSAGTAKGLSIIERQGAHLS